MKDRLKFCLAIMLIMSVMLDLDAMEKTPAASKDLPVAQAVSSSKKHSTLDMQEADFCKKRELSKLELSDEDAEPDFKKQDTKDPKKSPQNSPIAKAIVAGAQEKVFTPISARLQLDESAVRLDVESVATVRASTIQPTFEWWWDREPTHEDFGKFGQDENS